MADVTLSAALPGGITIALPVSSSDPSNSIATSALAGLTSQVSSGSLSLKAFDPAATTGISTVPASTVIAGNTVTVAGGIAVGSVKAVTVTGTVTVAGGGTSVTSATTGGIANLGTLSDNNTTVINTDTSGGTVAVISATTPATLIAGGGSNTAYVNRSSSGSVLLTGGNSYIGNSGTNSSTATTLTGGTSLGDGRAYIDATTGSSSVVLGDKGLINVNSNSSTQATVQAQAGTVVISVSNATVTAGGNTVPAVVQVAGATTAGSKLIYIQNGGNAFINPNASDVVVLAGSYTGSETIAGGTGSTTVFGGRGVFTGGSAGGNYIESGIGTVQGVSQGIGATITAGADAGGKTIFAGFNDWINLRSTGNLAIAGSGVDLITDLSAGGNTFRSGTGTTTIFGGAGGSNSFELGSGSAVVYGQHGAIAASKANADTYQLYAAGGSDTIGDFAAGIDVFKLSAGYAAGGSSGAPTTVAGSAVLTGQDLSIRLSDGTRLTFIGVNTTDTTKIFT